MAAALNILVGRIERLALDAVVNAANRALAPGAGVDGALRAAAGPGLTRLTDTMAAIETGAAVLTPGFNLPARTIIHTAAPVWAAPGDEAQKREGLAACYASCLALAAQHDLQEIAFPCLGTGIYGWPREIACEIAIEECARAPIARVVFCCFSETDADVYRARLG